MTKRLNIILPILFGIFFFFLDFVLSHYGESPLSFRLIVWSVIQSSSIYFVLYYFLIVKKINLSGGSYLRYFRVFLVLLLSIITSIVAYFIFRLVYPSPDHGIENLKIYMIWVVSIISFFEGLLFIFLFQTLIYYKEKTRLGVEREQLRQETIKGQFELLKSEINPHYLFNNFNTLYGLIQEDPKLASEYLLNFSQLFRYILSTQEKDTVSLREEIVTAKSYIYVLKERYQGQLSIAYNISDHLLEHRIVPLGMQLLLENAIKHNQIDEDHPMEVMISIQHDRIEIKNSLSPKKYPNESSGKGLSNLRNRYALITDHEIIVIRDERFFSISLPLFKPNHESINH